MQTPTEYEYHEFQRSDEIRLLKLHSKNDSLELTAELLHVQLGDFLAYDAVSYTWADSRGDHHSPRPVELTNNEELQRRSLEVQKACY